MTRSLVRKLRVFCFSSFRTPRVVCQEQANKKLLRLETGDRELLVCLCRRALENSISQIKRTSSIRLGAGDARSPRRGSQIPENPRLQFRRQTTIRGSKVWPHRVREDPVARFEQNPAEPKLNSFKLGRFSSCWSLSTSAPGIQISRCVVRESSRRSSAKRAACDDHQSSSPLF